MASQGDIAEDASLEAVGKGGSKEDQFFDQVIGSIEEIIMRDDFRAMLDNFMAAHCEEFDDEEENKLSYTPIFNEYTALVEKFLNDNLQAMVPKFEMAKFLKMLPSRKDEISEDVFDLLSSFGDFVTFKEEILVFKKAQHGQQPDFGLDIKRL